MALAFAGLSGVVIATATTASAATSPIADGTAASVTADALPTAQMNGVAWTQQIAGNTVYVGGGFTKARPAGAAAGTSEVTRTNLMAYTLSTGVMTSWAPVANGAVRSSALSPDGSVLYIGGDFTTINGVSAQHVAAFNASTGAMITSFAARTDAQVRAIAATSSTVYLGGSFSTTDGVARAHLSAVSAANGAIQAWNPGSDTAVWSMTMNPNNSLVIVGGSFSTLASAPAQGLGAVDPVSGARVAWLATNSVSAYGQDNAGPGTGAAIYSLSHDATNVYGTAYNFYGMGNLEGTFSADGVTGAITWIEDCHGDTYGVYAGAGAVYTTGHRHYCGNIGGFPQTDPWTFHHGLAFTTQATGTINHETLGYADFFGNPSPSLVNWFPDFTTGNYTGLGQAGWSVTGNSQYVVIGGEFPTVNLTAQQGLVRFAVPSIAPNKQGPRQGSSTWTPTVRALASTTARVAFPANWDRDDQNLTYTIYRNNKLIYTVPATSTFWNRPTITYMDNTVVGGTAYSYQIRVTDKNANIQYSATVSITMPVGAALSPYANDIYADGATNYWRLDETTGTTVSDWAGTSDMTLSNGYTQGGSGAIIGDSDTSDAFDGNNGLASTTTAVQGPDVFSEEAFFKTTTTVGGKIIGFGNASSGNSSSYDRHTYMNPNGTISFGVYNGNTITVTSAKSYNDGQWHQVVGTLSAAGVVLYIDGKRIGTNTNAVNGQSYSGYWRIGGDSSWNGNNYFNGSVDEAAIYPTALTLAQVQKHYTDSGRTIGNVPAPTDNYGKTIYADQPDLYYRLDDTTGTTAADASGNGNVGTYSGDETLGVSSPVSGATGTAVQFNGNNGTLASSGPVNGPAVYSEEAWINTTSTGGGKIIGFGNQPSGNSGSYDRHVYMLANGQIAFGAYTGQLNIAQTNSSFNDGQWHYVVATQGSDGMKLYVDGQLLGTNPNTGQQPYNGYWRIGGDTSWSGNSFFNGKIDEAAVYSAVLTPAQIAAHYAAATVPHPPTAQFTTTTTDLTAALDASGSTDPNQGGTITSYSWNFGDNTTGTGVQVSHPYAATGTYTVTLTVTDNNGLSATTTKSVTVTAAPPNQAPVANFTSVVNDLAVQFTSTSSDPDGTIASYSWNFGDGPTLSTLQNPSHTYAGAGTYQVSLTVTDDKGANTSIIIGVTVTAPNVAPTASFNTSINGLAVNFSSTSTDSDGNIASYAWNFGDTANNTSSSMNPSHTFSGSGTYQVKLTVTDNKGASTDVTNAVTVVAPNVVPVVTFTSSSTGLNYVFNSAGTNDPDGTITAYAWNFGDSLGTSTSANPSYTYPTAGTYTVTLTVTDNSGATSSTSQVVNPAPIPNVLPTASFTSTNTGLSYAFTSTSTDPDGTIASYSWNFGDNSGSSNNQNPSYVYSQAGTYTVTLTVTDNNGGTGTTTKVINAAPVPNVKPTAVFSSTNVGLNYTFSSAGTTDPDGTVVSYAWDFGDNSGSSNNPNPTYLFAAGTYTVSLTVTDNSGGSTTVTHVITAAPAPNVLPTATFTATASGLSYAFSSAGSGDTDGTIVGYAWTFGDNVGTSALANPSYTYAQSGTYTVTLTVTDNSGGTATATQTITTAASHPDIALDTFQRNVSNGWANATTGGAWTRVNGAATAHSVDGSAGRMTVAALGGTVAEYLNSVNALNESGTVDFSLSSAPTGGGIYTYVALRHTASGEYRIRLKLIPGSTTISLDKVVGTTETAIVTTTSTTTLVYNAGDVLHVKFDLNGTGGTTTFSTKVWKGSVEPSAWLLTTTDSTAALQTAGTIGIIGYLSGGAGTVAGITMITDNLHITQD